MGGSIADGNKSRLPSGTLGCLLSPIKQSNIISGVPGRFKKSKVTLSSCLSLVSDIDLTNGRLFQLVVFCAHSVQNFVFL